MPTLKRAGRGALAATCAWALAGCTPDAPPRPNLLLITVDTLRADALGVYGYDRPTSPGIDAWARGAARFESAMATSSWTLPTLATLHTGQLPSTTHTPDFAASLPLEFDTLAERLRVAGFETAAIATHTFLGVRHGLHQGFTHFDDDMVLYVADSHAEVTSDRVTGRAMTFIDRMEAARERNGDRPWFLWVHYFDPHDSYLAHEGFSEPFGLDDNRDLYDGEIAYTDHHLSTLLDYLEQSGVADQTLVCLVADHGEEWRDHGGLKHGETLYEEVLRVPLLFAGPGVEPGVVEEPVSTLDVFPTLHELLGLPLDTTAGPGTSLVELWRGGGLDRERGEMVAELQLGTGRELLAIRAGDEKLILDLAADTAALYDLGEDPLEQRDLSALRPERVEQLSIRLGYALDVATQAGQPFAPSGAVGFSPGERGALSNLGYVDDEPEPLAPGTGVSEDAER
ncbi:MAG: sulfatase [Planctomycetota bacterium]